MHPHVRFWEADLMGDRPELLVKEKKGCFGGMVGMLTIADVIKGRCTSLYRITARKMFRNRYTLTIETRKREYRRFAQQKGLTPDPVCHEEIDSEWENP